MKKDLKMYYNIYLLQKEIDIAVNEIENDSDDLYLQDDDIKTYFLETLTGGSSGIYQSRELIDMFELYDETIEYKDNNYNEDNIYNDEVWEDVLYSFFDKLADALKKEVILPNNYNLYFGHSENDGDFNMILMKNIE